MPSKLIAVPFTAVVTEATPYTFPVPKEALPSTSRFGNRAAPAKKRPTGLEIVTRAAKITSAAFTPSAAAAAKGSLTSLRVTTDAVASATGATEPQTFALVAFSNERSAAGPSPSVAASAAPAATAQLSTRLFITAGTTLSVVGPGTVSLFGEELHETYTAPVKRKKRRAEGEQKKKKDGGDEESDFDDGRSFGGDDMYDQGIVYN